jgi:hypothetical protein
VLLQPRAIFISAHGARFQAIFGPKWGGGVHIHYIYSAFAEFAPRTNTRV